MKNRVKIIAALLSATVAAAAVPLSASAEDGNNKEQIRIIVENTNCTAEDGAKWSGILVDQWVDIDADSTLLGKFAEVMSAEGYTQTGADTGYVTEINGLSAYDCGSMSGWMLTIDNWITDSGADSFTVASGKLEDGDEVIFKYTADWGSDLVYDWQGTSTKLSDLYIGGAELSPEFSADVTEYTVELPSDTESITVTPSAENNAFRTKIYKNEYKPENKTDCKISREIDVKDGDVIYVGVGNSNWQYIADGVEETVYKVTLKIPGDNNTEESSKEPENPEESSVPEKSSDNKSDISIDDITKEITQAVKSNESFAVAGNEWEVIALARFGYLSESDKSAYIASVKDYVDSVGKEKLSETKSTDNSKLILALTAAGCDASDFYGYNLTAPLADFDYTSKQGINGVIYALIALDSHNYEIPDSSEAENQTTREKLVDEILSAQLEDGGWTFFGDVSDPDMTSMSLYALAPYYNTDERVKTAADKAVSALSDMQLSNGAYASFGTQGCDSGAQVVIALSALGIDSSSDERFVKNGNSVLESLELFYHPELKAFSYMSGENEAANIYSTDQALIALCAYSRFANGQNFIYNMNDVEISAAKNEEVSEDNKKESSNTESSKETSNENSENSDSVSDSANESNSSENTTLSGSGNTTGNNSGNNSSNSGSQNNSVQNESADSSTVKTGDNFGIVTAMFLTAVGAAAAIIASSKKRLIKK